MEADHDEREQAEQAFESGTRKRSEIAATAPTNSYCVTSSTTLIRYTPLAPSRSP